MKVKPTQKQLDFLDWEFGMFFHFGIRSFFPGHVDWDGRPMPASEFNPEKLDCRQWIRIAKKAGAKYAILTCKHHDGFANWQSKNSDYSVAQSPWQDGKGDVVAEFVKACRAYGMKVGLYYSPAQWSGAVSFDDPKAYDEYFIDQITELCTNYGDIDILWFDGCGSENHEYDKERIIKVIRTLQPKVRLNMWDSDSRWIGNEDGYTDMPNNNAVDRTEFSMFATEARELGTTRYLPAECDLCMRAGTWFDCESNADTVKSVEELVGIYDYSVGRGADMLLNIGPDRNGLLPEPDAKRLLEFGDELRRRYGTPLPFGEAEKTGGSTWTIKADDSDGSWNPAMLGTELVDTAVIQEDITDGDAIQEFRLYANLPRYGKTKVCVYSGFTVGHKAICHFPLIRTSKLTLEVVKSDGEAKLRSFKAYKVN